LLIFGQKNCKNFSIFLILAADFSWFKWTKMKFADFQCEVLQILIHKMKLRWNSLRWNVQKIGCWFQIIAVCFLNHQNQLKALSFWFWFHENFVHSKCKTIENIVFQSFWIILYDFNYNFRLKYSRFWLTREPFFSISRWRIENNQRYNQNSNCRLNQCSTQSRSWIQCTPRIPQKVINSLRKSYSYHHW
jgi:hypothetical protein